MEKEGGGGGGGGIPQKIRDKIGLNLHNVKGHPLCTTKELVQKWLGFQASRYVAARSHDCAKF